MNTCHLAYFRKIHSLQQSMNNFTSYVKNEIVTYCQQPHFAGELSAKLDNSNDLIIEMPSIWKEFISSQKFIVSHQAGVYVRLNFHENNSHILGLDFFSDGKVNILESAINFDGSQVKNGQTLTLQFDYNDVNLIPAIIENLFLSATLR
ncbi:TPA: hypothetical protein ACGCAO_000017 [Enterobacter cloacae]|nr:hypothetical protein [Enterobacter hormaechei subsp. steigerwaltii]HED5660163.1 hypothetical protein [Enterobacter cloacae]